MIEIYHNDDGTQFIKITEAIPEFNLYTNALLYSGALNCNFDIDEVEKINKEFLKKYSGPSFSKIKTIAWSLLRAESPYREKCFKQIKERFTDLSMFLDFNCLFQV